MMDDRKGNFVPVPVEDDYKLDKKDNGSVFKVGEIVKIKDSYFTVRNLSFVGIMTLKLLTNNEETEFKYARQTT
jgi:uncharacterized pyridoxal phosphate-containing UPF0001 family protein